MTSPGPATPNRIPWPPILLASAVLGALALDRMLISLPPIPFAETVAARGLGWALIAAGIGLWSWAHDAFKRAGTTVLPHRPSAALVTTGPFAFSRNPIYLGISLALVGVALVLNKLAFLLVVPVFMGLVWGLAIRREERYLLNRFGDEWADYADRVRRWV